MSLEGRWVAAAEILLVICSLASCSNSAVEGAKWKVDPLTSQRPAISSPRRKIDDKWEEVTYVLEKARENATFPGMFLCTIFMGHRGGGARLCRTLTTLNFHLYLSV